MTPSALKKKDISLLNKTLFDLAKPRLLLRIFVVALACAIWLWVAQWLLNFGARQDYAFLDQFSTQIVTFLNSINKYIWWGVILIGNLVLYFMLYSWISGSIERAGSIVPKQEVINKLINGLSPDGKNVLAWVWQDQREPITIRVLDQTRDQLKGPRVQRLAQVEQQRRLLGLPSVEAQTLGHSVVSAPAQEAVYSSAIAQETPDQARAKVDALLADVNLQLEAAGDSLDSPSLDSLDRPLDPSINRSEPILVDVQAQPSVNDKASVGDKTSMGQEIPTLAPSTESTKPKA